MTCAGYLPLAGVFFSASKQKAHLPSYLHEYVDHEAMDGIFLPHHSGYLIFFTLVNSLGTDGSYAFTTLIPSVLKHIENTIPIAKKILYSLESLFFIFLFLLLFIVCNASFKHCPTSFVY